MSFVLFVIYMYAVQKEGGKIPPKRKKKMIYFIKLTKYKSCFVLNYQNTF